MCFSGKSVSRSASESGSSSGCLGCSGTKLGERGAFYGKKSYKVLGCLGPRQPTCPRKGKRDPRGSVRFHWVLEDALETSGFSGKGGVSCLSVSTLIRAGKGAVEGCMDRR